MGEPGGAALVFGGGIGGMQAALDLAESGIKVYLVESNPSIGGVMAQLDKTFPTNDCAMCTMAPRLVEIGRHQDIEIITLADIESLAGEPGNFTAILKKRPRYVDGEKCTGCGNCVGACPVKDTIPDEYNTGLHSRPAIYIPYPQAVPNTAVIDDRYCLRLLHGKCGLCSKVCQAGAVDYDQQPEQITLRVGAVVLAPGSKPFDATLKKEYGYGTYPDVITSLEFERILSPSGPFHGRILRPSDETQPGRIAFLQCVGSRDVNAGRHCSAVCCMYAVKEALIAREHDPDIEATIFFMDIRAHGKGFEAYYQRGQDNGIRFIRSRVAAVRKDSTSGSLVLKFTAPDETVQEEPFDLVVLSIGLQPPALGKTAWERLGIELNEHLFCRTGLFHPVESSRPGVFATGPFTEPKDIPETVMQASGAAARVLALLKDTRGSLTQPPEFPPETDIAGREPRIGVFVCHCGTNIASVIEVSSVADYAKTLPGVVYAGENLYACSNDAQEKIKELIEEHSLNRVVVASCTPRTHEPLFRNTVREAGLNPYLFEMANIRDQCSWVHREHPARATAKARGLVRMAVARALLLEPLPRSEIGITRAALVIGGGLAGMTAALDLADQLIPVYLVEREKQLGGNLRRLRYLLDGTDPQVELDKIIHRVNNHDNIQVFTGARVDRIEGFVGNFKSVISVSDGGDKEVDNGVIIVATGAAEHRPEEYLYGRDEKIMTQFELEDKLAAGEIQPAPGQTVVMIQCVGSRDDERPYCSRVCCSQAVKNALQLKEACPGVSVYILYRDMRTYGFREDYYVQAQEKGITFIRYDEDRKPEVTAGGSGLHVIYHDLILDAPVSIPAHLVVLSAGTVAEENNRSLAQLLKVPLNEDNFFLEAHLKLRPVDFASDGMFLCGLAHSPKSVEETVAQAEAAAGKASTVLNKNVLLVEGAIAVVKDNSRCRSCERCLDVCEFNAIEMAEEQDGIKVSRINPSVCKSCGACAAICPTGAITARHFNRNQIDAMIEAALEEDSHGG